MGEISRIVLTMNDFCKKMKGRWVQVKQENMDAIYVASDFPTIKRTIAGMMGVHLQVDFPADDEIFLSFQTKLKNMDMKLSLSKETSHTGFKDEPVKSTIKFDGDKMILSTTGMAYGSTTRYFEYNPQGQLVNIQTIGDVKGTRWFEKEN